MGTLEDIQEADRETQQAVARVTEAARQLAYHGTDQDLSDTHMAVDAAKSAIRQEQALLRQVLQRLEAIDADVKSRRNARRERAAREEPYRVPYHAGHPTEDYASVADRYDERQAAYRPPTPVQRFARQVIATGQLGVGSDVERWRRRHGGTGLPTCGCLHDPPCAACAASIDKFGCSCRPGSIQESRYAAPSPPDNERYDEWRRTHGG